MTTIRDVATACGVSPMTVSLVLNNNGGRVSAKTRERVLRAVRELDYRPRAAEPTSKRKTTNVIGLMTQSSGPSFIDPGYGNWILRGVLRATDQHEKHLLLFTKTRLLEADPHVSIRQYCDGRCDGLLVLAPPANSPLVAAIAERGFPMVVIAYTGEDAYLSVDLDNVGEARKLTGTLLALGHRRIAFVGGPDFVPSSVQRLKGYRDALEQAGIPRDPALEVTNIVYPAETQGRVKALFALPAPRRPTGIVGWHDGSAVDALHAVQELGLRVPEDISIVGINDDPATSQCTPALTTVRQPYDEISRIALEMLLAQVHGEDIPTRNVLLPGTLIERASCGPAPTP